MRKNPPIRRALSLTMSLALAASLAAPASAVSGSTATIQNFISGLWERTDGNGLPTSEFTEEFLDRAISMGVDEDGNALRAIDEQDIRYFDGKYYLYGTDFSYGSFLYASGTNMLPVTTKTQDAEGNDVHTYFRYGGLSVYSSDDLMNWTLETTSFIQDEETGFIYTVKKPRVVYSEATGKYVLWFLGENSTGQIYCAEADSPTGPWSNVRHPSFEAENMSLSTDFGQDFDIVRGPDGTHWAVTSHAGVKVYQLDETCTHILDMVVVKESSGGIWSGAGLGGGIGLHWHQDDNGKVWWYVTGSNICGNCISANFYYLMAEDSPMNDWHGPDPEKPDTDGLIANTTVMSGAQVHSAKILPDADGEMHALIPATHYRTNGTQTSLNNAGNNALAQGGMYLLTLDYNEDGTIKAIEEMPDSIEFPLANEVESSAPPAYEMQLSVTKDQSVEYSWELDGSEPLAAVLPSVFQYTPMYRDNNKKIPQEPLVNEPLIATLELPDGTTQTWEIDARTVRFAPTQVALNLDEPYTGTGTATLTLSTQAYSDNPFALESNGVSGYGVAVGLMEDTQDSTFSLPGAEYAVVDAEGVKTVREGVDMLIQTSDEAIGIPKILDQSGDLDIEPYAESEITADSWALADDPGSATGFYIQAEGVGVGYQWYKDGEPILSPAGWNDSYGPTFRIMYPQVEDSGVYTCYVFNQAGGVWSEPMVLTVGEEEEDSGSSSGSGSTTTYYDIAVDETDNGTVTVSLDRAPRSSHISITAVAGEGYQVRSATVTAADGSQVELTDLGSGKYNFVMPSSDVTVSVVFVQTEEDEEAAMPFTDVADGSWYYAAAGYVYENGLMSGVSDTLFAPNSCLTRGMIVQVLYSMEGQPEHGDADFTDVAADAWYADAVAWAAENGIVSGYGDGLFGPNDNITREQMALILYRYGESKGYDLSGRESLDGFADREKVSGWAADSMSWAVGSGMLSGKGGGILDPTGTATRAEVAQILMNFCQNIAK